MNSVDRISGPQREFGIYKPLDLAKVKMDQFQPAVLEVVRKNTTLDGNSHVNGLCPLVGEPMELRRRLMTEDRA